MRIRTYNVTTHDGKTYRMNRQHLWTCAESRVKPVPNEKQTERKPNHDKNESVPEIVQIETIMDSHQPLDIGETFKKTNYKTRSGRVVKWAEILDL